ncbi:MAG: 4a-hydroxytetrahydrobiopterin dehydratase [Acidimicrobiales bacterium]
MTVPPPLSAIEVDARLAELPGWDGDTSEISKTFEIEYHTGVRMVVDVARDAKERGHHPDIHVTWGQVRFDLTTHDAGYVVIQLDLNSARAIDEIAAQHGAIRAERPSAGRDR